MVRLATVLAVLLISGLIGSAPIAANANDRVAVPQRAAGEAKLAERTIVCGPRRCWTLREGCRLVLAPLPRNNRIVCQRVRPA